MKNKDLNTGDIELDKVLEQGIPLEEFISFSFPKFIDSSLRIRTTLNLENLELQKSKFDELFKKGRELTKEVDIAVSKSIAPNTKLDDEIDTVDGKKQISFMIFDDPIKKENR